MPKEHRHAWLAGQSDPYAIHERRKPEEELHMVPPMSEEEYAARRARVREIARAQGATGFVIVNPTNVTYLTGFRFLSPERPVIYLQNAAGDDVIFVPEFELERTQAEANFDRIETYLEYPGSEHPMVVLARVVADLGLNKTIAVDTDGYPGILGYTGPSLSAVTNAKVVEIANDIEQMLIRKSPAELELIRESGRWCSYAHRLLQQFSGAGATETEAS